MNTPLQFPQRKQETESIEFTRLKNDVNGNPRYVCSFLHLISNEKGSIAELYEIAAKKANKIGGRKYNTKAYGGGIVFQSYCLPDLEKRINEVK